MLACKRITINGGALLVAAGCFGLLAGDCMNPAWRDSLIAANIALVISLAATHGIGALLQMPGQPSQALWMPGQRQRLVGEIMLLAIIIPLAHIQRESGYVMFTILLALVGAQALRHAQINRTQRTLQRRIHEPSLVNSIGHNLSASLKLEGLFDSLHDWVAKLDLTLFFIALRDPQSNTIRFPLVVRGQRRLREGDNDFLSDPLTRQMLVIGEGTSDHVDPLEMMTTQTSFHALPLRAGDKYFGIMGLIENGEGQREDRLSADTLETLAAQIGLAVRNASLYERTVDLAENLQQMNRSVQDVMFNADIEGAIRAACQTACAIVNADRAAAFIMDENGNVRQIIAHQLPPHHLALYDQAEFLPPLRDRPNFLHDVRAADYPPLQRLGELADFSSMACLPISSGNLAVGVLQVFHDKQHFYQNTECELLETVAHQVAAAVDNAHLVATLEAYAAEQTQLVHLSRISAQSLDVDRTVTNVSRLLRQILNTSWAGIAMMPPGVNYLQLRRTDGERDAVLLDDLPEIRDAVADLKNTLIVLHRDDENTAPESVYWMRVQKIETLAGSVLVADEQAVGVILLGEGRRREFSDSDKRLLETASNHVATQLYNALKYQDTLETLEWRLRQLSLIEGIAQQISSALDLETLIYNLLEASLRATVADMSSLVLITDAGYMRVILLLVDENGELVFDELYRDSVTGVVSQVFESGKTVILDDNTTHPDYVDVPGRAYHSSLVVPLMQNETVIGVLNVESNEYAHFNSDQATFLASLAGHAVVSIQNARLLQDQLGQIETLNQLRSLAIRLSGDVEAEAALATIGEAAMTLLEADSVTLARFEPQNRTLQPLLNAQPITDALALRVAMSAIKINEPQSEQTKTEEGFYRSVIAVPIPHDGEIYVLIALMGHTFRNRDLNAAVLLGIQAAAHLQNVTLYQRIRTQNSRMQAILDSTRDGVLLIERNGYIMDTNAVAEELLGLPLYNYIGKHIERDLIPDVMGDLVTDEPLPLVNILQQTIRSLAVDSRRITASALEIQNNDNARYVHQVGSPVIGNRGEVTGRLLTFRDVTDEQMLAAYRDEIASMVVHDLRGPLGSMITSLALMQEMEEAQDSEELTALLRLTMNSGEKLMGLVNSLLTISKLEKRRMPIQRAWTTVNDLTADAINALSGLAQSANIAVTAQIAEDLPAVFVDADKIRRVLINLIDNALRYTPANGQIVVLAGLQDEDKVRVQVCDSGPGIADEHAERIFEKFSQLDDANRRGEKGSGLGLTYCKLALEAHSERIWLDKEAPLSGACFAFTLPITARRADETALQRITEAD